MAILMLKNTGTRRGVKTGVMPKELIYLQTHKRSLVMFVDHSWIAVVIWIPQTSPSCSFI
jgi:hypothetical protein